MPGLFSHLGQCLLRKVFELLYKKEYETEEEFPKAIRMFSSLALLPPSEVVPAFETLCDYVSTKQVERNGQMEQLVPDDFQYYVEKNFIGLSLRRSGQRKIPMYPISFWSCYDRVMEGHQRTNNDHEGLCTNTHRSC